MKAKPEITELDVEQLQRNLDKIEQELGEETARPFRMLLGWYLSLLKFIQAKGTTIAHVRKLLFGSQPAPTTAESQEPVSPSDAPAQEEGVPQPDGTSDHG